MEVSDWISEINKWFWEIEHPTIKITPLPDPLPITPIGTPDGSRIFTDLYYYPVDYGSPRHLSFAYILCSEFSTLRPAHIVNWYLCAFNLYVSPLSVALQNYKPSREMHPAKVTPKALPLSDSAISDYETFVSKSKTDPSYHGWFNQTDFTNESVAELFTSNIDADDRQTIETVNIYYLCLLTLAMFKEPTGANYSYWIKKREDELKNLLLKAGCSKLFPTLRIHFGADRLKPLFQKLESLSEFRATLMKSFIDLVFGCRDGISTSTFFTPYNYVIKMLEYTNMSLVPLIKTNIIDPSHPIRHASFTKSEVTLFEKLQKDLDKHGRHSPYAKILNVMPDCYCRAKFPNLLAACTLLSPWDKRSHGHLNRIQKSNHLLIPLLEAIDLSHVKWEKLTANQVLQMEAKATTMQAKGRSDFNKEVDLIVYRQ